MSLARRIVSLTAPVVAFCGWVFTGVPGPYDDVRVALAFLLIMSALVVGFGYLLSRPDEAQREARFYYLCYGTSGVIFVAAAAARLLGLL